MPTRPYRSPWNSDFPSISIHSPESAVKQHMDYPAAKAGNVDSAWSLVVDTWSDDAIVDLVELGSEMDPILISVHAEEAVGVNAIPEVLAEALAGVLKWEVERDVVQANVVNHTGAGGFARMARQAVFEGTVIQGRNYVIVDDFIGQGGTIANLRGHIIEQGGIVIGATVLTGKDFSAILKLENDRLIELRARHGQIEDWWQERFGFGFDCLTASEARYLINTKESTTICARIEEADNAS